ncbi:response regulator [Pedobacter rhodius]|uniref:Response regulator transcription factor n=1 Tax=Pedobacter rhodius TaxID=3004098 RepID=A0ABT4KWM5_9SPHI|nr:response regulator transcription factor [Pedobacter sp. SJ11]MCZ4223343.1 response regulator transcription factor [Pedobacter sp. SJ11]
MLNPKTKLAIVDDHPIVIEGLLKLLSRKNEFEIAGTFTNGNDFVEFLKLNELDIVLLDIILPDINGIDLCKKIKEISASTVVLALSNHEERSAIMKMIENGASGYLLKNASVEELMHCISEALNGRKSFSKAVTEIIAKPELYTTSYTKLTRREIEILKLIASGITTPNIARQLFLSKFTVENHRKNLLQKLNAKNVAELISTASQHNLL